MPRGPTGRFVLLAGAGSDSRAFVPHRLPPNPPVVLDPPLQLRLERASHALGQLDGISPVLPGTPLFIYSYVRREAVLSSQIEGTQSSLSDLLLFELAEAPGVPVDDVREVSNYVSALEHGLARLAEGLPLSGRLLRELHARLLDGSRGADKDPGAFRRSQVWLGGTSPESAGFVPPPHTEIDELIADLERFLHAGDGLPGLVRAAVAHVQFETIHPFLDGNGRVGRLLITLMLREAGLMREPLLYLSLHFKRHRTRYYELLDAVRDQGDWEAWIGFFLDGVIETARGAVATAERLMRGFETDRARLAGLKGATSSLLSVHRALQERPLLTIREAARLAGVTWPTAGKALGRLVEVGFVDEITGRRRGRVYAYRDALAILAEDGEPPA